MRTFFFILLLTSIGWTAYGQEKIPVAAVDHFENLVFEGNAVGVFGKMEITIGGLVRLKGTDLALAESNRDIYVRNMASGQVVKISVDYLSPVFADQFGAAQFGFVTDHDYLYLLGGAGFDWTTGCMTTFGQMCIIPIQETADYIWEGRDPSSLIKVLADPDLAITEGRLFKMMDYFLIYDGKRIYSRIEEESGICTVPEEESYKGQLRTFRLFSNNDRHIGISDFRVCYGSETFHDCLPVFPTPVEDNEDTPDPNINSLW